MTLYLLIFATLLLCEIFYFRIAKRLNIVDKPNERSSHTHVTLRGGGVIFPLSVLLYTLVFGVGNIYFLVGLGLISAVSFADDVRGVSNRVRLLIHFISIMLLIYGLGAFSNIAIVIASLIVCVGIINAYNFMDGINGITAGYSLAVLVPMVLLNREIGFVDANMLYTVLLGVMVFMIFNFRARARCFAGDVGAVSMAYIILFCLGALILATGNFWYITLLMVYGVDSTLTIIHRLMLRENIFQAHRKHLYQILANEAKVPHRVVSALYAVLQVAVSVGFIYSGIDGAIYFFGVATLLAIAYILVKNRFYHLHN